MGYLVAMHITKDRPNVAVLKENLPKSIDFQVYYNSLMNIYAVDTYKATKIPKYPFCTATPATDISLELGSTLDDAYESLRKEGSVNGFKRAYAKISEILSSSLGQAVLTIYSDDDDCDFACIAEKGKVIELICRVEGGEINFAADLVSISSSTEFNSLHRNALKLFDKFVGAPGSKIGLGTLDPLHNLGFVDS